MGIPVTPFSEDVKQALRFARDRIGKHGHVIVIHRYGAALFDGSIQMAVDIELMLRSIIYSRDVNPEVYYQGGRDMRSIYRGTDQHRKKNRTGV